MASESKTVVYAALAGNLAVAVSKYVAAALSGSSAMLTEAVHSTADVFNQLMLLLGNRLSQRPADERHPFGYGGEIYFWTFVVAVMVLLAGGAMSIYQGIEQLRHPHPIESLRLSLIVLALSALFEGGSLLIGYRESRRMVARHPGDGRPVSLWRYIKVSKDPNLYETLLEDSAALIGIAIAAAGVLGSTLTGLLWLDGAASVAIGLLLVADSYVIAAATRGLIAGEAAAPALRMEVREALKRDGLDQLYTDLRTLHVGPNSILVTLALTDVDADPTAVRERLATIERCIGNVDERFTRVYCRIEARS